MREHTAAQKVGDRPIVSCVGSVKPLGDEGVG